MQDKIINADDMYVGESPDLLKSLDITEKNIKKMHRKFILILKEECGVNKKSPAVGFKKFLGELNAKEERAFLMIGMSKLNHMTNEMAYNKQIDKKRIVIPGQDTPIYPSVN